MKLQINEEKLNEVSLKEYSHNWAHGVDGNSAARCGFIDGFRLAEKHHQESVAELDLQVQNLSMIVRRMIRISERKGNSFTNLEAIRELGEKCQHLLTPVSALRESEQLMKDLR